MWSRRSLLALFVFALAPSAPLFAPPPSARPLPGVFPGERVVQWGEGRSQQTYQDLVIADVPELHTRILYSRAGLVPANARGLVLLYPGTGARVDSDYGIERSLAPLAHELVGRGYAVMAFQPPIYWRAEAPAERGPYLTEYGNLEGNLRWLVRTLELAEGHVPHGTDGRPALEISGVFRSTFAALALEGLHRAALGEPRFAPLRRLRRILAVGVDGHSPSEIEAWHRAEHQFLLVERPEMADREVVLAAPRIFKDMGWGTTSVPVVGGAETGFPSLWVALGSRDEFVQGRVSELFAPVVRFSENHRQIPVTVAWHDGHHDLGREVRDGDVVVAPRLARLRLVLDHFFGPEIPRNGALQVHPFPDANAVFAPLDEFQRKACGFALVELSPRGKAPRVRSSGRPAVTWPLLGPPWMLE